MYTVYVRNSVVNQNILYLNLDFEISPYVLPDPIPILDPSLFTW